VFAGWHEEGGQPGAELALHEGRIAERCQERISNDTHSCLRLDNAEQLNGDVSIGRKPEGEMRPG
jgi:hypothetical protein